MQWHHGTHAFETRNRTLPPPPLSSPPRLLLPRVLLSPALRLLHKLLPLLFILLSNPRLDRIIRHRLDQKLSREL